MGDAGTQDLRGTTVLPYLAVVGHPRDPALAQAVAELRTWQAGGSHRINRARPGASGTYQQGDAIRIMDAWWPLLVRAEFGPVLGTALLAQVQGEFPINDQPGHGTSGPHLGSAFDVGFYGSCRRTCARFCTSGWPIQYRAIGAIKQPLMEWINRPTFQQADEIQGHRAP